MIVHHTRTPTVAPVRFLKSPMSSEGFQGCCCALEMGCNRLACLHSQAEFKRIDTPPRLPLFPTKLGPTQAWAQALGRCQGACATGRAVQKHLVTTIGFQSSIHTSKKSLFDMATAPRNTRVVLFMFDSLSGSTVHVLQQTLLRLASSLAVALPQGIEFQIGFCNVLRNLLEAPVTLAVRIGQQRRSNVYIGSQVVCCQNNC